MKETKTPPVTCGKCNGKGWIGHVVCWVCKGRGVLLAILAALALGACASNYGTDLIARCGPNGVISVERAHDGYGSWIVICANGRVYDGN